MALTSRQSKNPIVTDLEKNDILHSVRGLPGLLIPVPRQMPIKLVCKRLPVALIERGGTTGFNAASTQLLHEIAHAQMLPDIVVGVELPSRVKSVSTLGNDIRRQWDIGGNHQIAWLGEEHYFSIGHIKAGRHLNCTNESGRWRAQQFIGNQSHRYLHPVGDTEQDFLDHGRTCISIDQNLHRIPVRSVK
ncbi:MAG: hypothetical protein A3I66_18365 [Burkholderiales bacterium RIFCSPLOWO2_02_FULL_57_36]|nr:MAG: hypothetical protein A3I66_18365 [Burkholderiales bacterium RIFCSPLOWO2_02_FULL_57_36]